MIGILAGVVANITAAVYYNQAADYNSGAAAAAGDIAAGDLLRMQAVTTMSLAGRIAAVQRVAEIYVLIMTISAFFVVMFYSLRIIASAMRALVSAEQKLVAAIAVADAAELREKHQIKNIGLFHQAGQRARKLKQKITLTFVWIFVTVLLLSVFMVAYGLSLGGQNFDDPCSPDHCHPCKNIYAHIFFWVLYNPWMQHMVMLVSSPVAMLVALWGMSDVHEIEQIENGERRRFFDGNRAGPIAKLQQKWQNLQGLLSRQTMSPLPHQL
jgi:hypothetical protein